MPWEVWVSGVLVLAGWFWWDGLLKREMAVRAARLACERSGVQFLDETVALKRLRLERDEDRRARVARQFAFEYSDTGNNRLSGHVYLLGSRVLQVNMVMPAPAEPPPPSWNRP